MKLISSKFNFNSTLASITKGKPDGIVRECLIDMSDVDKDQQLVNNAFSVEKAVGSKVYISVKFPYGSRPKRIEIVFKLEPFVVLCKFTNSKKVDEAALDLQTIISSANEDCAHNLYKGLVIYPGNNQIVITDKFATNQIPDVRFEELKNLKSGNLHGIFNKPKSSG
jgi:hypothetical protein